MPLAFEWDANKARENARKHGVTFEEALTIFYDELVATMVDSRHSADEDRYISIGTSVRQRLLVVVHTERGDRTRILSSRPATALERRQYEEGSSEDKR